MLTRRSFMRQSVAFLASLGLVPEVLSGERPQLESPGMHFELQCWRATSEAIRIGPEPVTVLQLEAKAGQSAIVREILLDCPTAAYEQPVSVTVCRQSQRASCCPAPLEGLFRRGSPAVYAWQSGCADHGADLLSLLINSRSYFRWVSMPGGELFLPRAGKIGFMATCEKPTWLYVQAYGRNRD